MFDVKRSRLTKILSKELWTGVSSDFVVSEKRFGAEVESTAFTRAGCFGLKELNDADNISCIDRQYKRNVRFHPNAKAQDFPAPGCYKP